MSQVPLTGVEEMIHGTWPLQGSGFIKTYTNNYNTIEYMLEKIIVLNTVICSIMTDSFIMPSILYSVIIAHER